MGLVDRILDEGPLHDPEFVTCACCGTELERRSNGAGLPFTYCSDVCSNYSTPARMTARDKDRRDQGQ